MRLRRSKGDQEGSGAKKGIPHATRPGLCAVRALAAWLEAAGITPGAIFRAVGSDGRVRPDALSGRSVARLVQKVAAAAGSTKQRCAHSASTLANDAGLDLSRPI